MGSWWFRAVGGAVVLLLAGCVPPGGGDSRLTDDWPPLKPALTRPALGLCYMVSADRLSESLRLSTQTECASSHQLETVHVGEFPADIASQDNPPTPGGTLARDAFDTCETKATQFLGADWHQARVALWISYPTRDAWDTGIKVYQCDLIEVASVTGLIKIRVGSLRGGLSGARPAAITCANHSGKDKQTVDELTFVPCSQRHTAEFIGVFAVTPPGRKFPGEDGAGDLAFDGCGEFAGEYVQSTRPRDELSLIYWGPTTKDQWELGDQSFRCYVAVTDPDKPIRAGATLRNLGDRAVPR